MSIAREFLKNAMAAVLSRKRYLLNGPAAPRRKDVQAPTEIALTFDDGPHPEWTPAVLDELSQAGWKGTFFIVGARAEQHPDVLQRIVDEGHAVGNHTFTHSAPHLTSPSEFLDEVRRTSELIRHLTGVSTTLMRPPLGKLTWGKFRGLWKSGQSMILWNVDPKDFAMQEESEALDWLRSYDPQTGDVVLLHDRLPYTPKIVQAMSELHGEAVRSVAVSEWVSDSQLTPAMTVGVH